jgi:hypothetical protein
MRPLLLCCSALTLWAQEPVYTDLGQQVAGAEAPVRELARQWIKDPRPVYKAWAAHVIRQHGWQGLFAADLIDALGDLSHLDASPETREDRMLRMVVLDALIQGSVRVPHDLSQALLNAYPAQALILLYAGMCPGVPVDTQILDGAKSDEAWLLAGQCLMSEKGGSTELLRRLQIAAEVNVFDPNLSESGEFGIPGGIGDTFIGGGFPPFPWPPAYEYALNVRGDVLLKGGRYPIRYSRGTTVTAVSSIHGDRNEYTLQILRYRLSSARESKPMVTHPTLELHWRTLEQYRSDLQAFVSDQQRQYAELVSQLVRLRMLTPEQGERSHLNLDIEIHDRRSHPTIPIPDLGLGEHHQ